MQPRFFFINVTIDVKQPQSIDNTASSLLYIQFAAIECKRSCSHVCEICTIIQNLLYIGYVILHDMSTIIYSLEDLTHHLLLFLDIISITCKSLKVPVSKLLYSDKILASHRITNFRNCSTPHCTSQKSINPASKFKC